MNCIHGFRGGALLSRATIEKLSQRVREKSLSIPPRNLRPIFSSLSVLLYSSKMIHAEDVFYVEERV